MIWDKLSLSRRYLVRLVPVVLFWCPTKEDSFVSPLDSSFFADDALDIKNQFRTDDARRTHISGVSYFGYLGGAEIWMSIDFVQFHTDRSRKCLSSAGRIVSKHDKKDKTMMSSCSSPNEGLFRTSCRIGPFPFCQFAVCSKQLLHVAKVKEANHGGDNASQPALHALLAGTVLADQ